MLYVLYITKLEVLNVLRWKWRSEVHGKGGQENEKLSVYITSIMIFILMISSSYDPTAETFKQLVYSCHDHARQRHTHPRRRDEATVPTVLSHTHRFFFLPDCWKKKSLHYIFNTLA